MGRKSHVEEQGGQGSLARMRKKLEEAELHEQLADGLVHEAMKLAREFLPADVRRLHEMIQDPEAAPAAVVAGVRAMHEIGYPKSAGRAAGGGRPSGKVVINLVDFAGGATRVEAVAMPVKALPEAIDAELDP